MLHPSYADLMKVVNSDVEEGNEPVVSSRYSIVMATSKRARQIISGDEVLVENYDGRKPLSAAIEELNQGKIRILNGDEALDDILQADIMIQDSADETELDAAQETPSDAAAEAASEEAGPEETASNGDEQN